MAHIGGYLVLVGLISTVVYGFATCSEIKVETLRYNLLGVLIPVGALVMALQTWAHPAVRAGLGAAVALWCALNTGDVVALTQEYRTHPPLDHATGRGRRPRTSRRADSVVALRDAYHITFLTQERVRVSANDFARIRSGTSTRPDRRRRRTLAEQPCANGRSSAVRISSSAA